MQAKHTLRETFCQPPFLQRIQATGLAGHLKHNAFRNPKSNQHCRFQIASMLALIVFCRRRPPRLPQQQQVLTRVCVFSCHCRVGRLSLARSQTWSRCCVLRHALMCRQAQYLDPRVYCLVHWMQTHAAMIYQKSMQRVHLDDSASVFKYSRVVGIISEHIQKRAKKTKSKK